MLAEKYKFRLIPFLENRDRKLARALAGRALTTAVATIGMDADKAARELDRELPLPYSLGACKQERVRDSIRLDEPRQCLARMSVSDKSFHPRNFVTNSTTLARVSSIEPFASTMMKRSGSVSEIFKYALRTFA